MEFSHHLLPFNDGYIYSLKPFTVKIPSEIVTSGKTIQIIRSESTEANILPSETEEMMECCSDDEAMIDGECVSLEDLESYKPEQEIDIEVAELKEGIEKKKKKRNYVEFREDYEQT